MDATYFKDNFKKESLKGQRLYNIVSDCSKQWDEYWEEQDYINFQGVCCQNYTVDTTHINSLEKAVPIIQKYIDKAN